MSRKHQQNRNRPDNRGRRTPSAALGDVLQLRTEKMIAGGTALARSATQQIVFVDNALPNETVTASVTQAKKSWVRAHTTAIEQAAPERVAIRCTSRIAGCGGCDWLHIDRAAQLEYKQDIVSDALRRTGGLADPPAPLYSDRVRSIAYRTTIRLHTNSEGQLGYRTGASHDWCSPAPCHVIPTQLRTLAESLQLEKSGHKSNADVVLRMSIATGELQIWSPQPAKFNSLAPPPAINQAPIREVVNDVALRVSGESFFQSGPEAAELLVAAVTRLAEPELKHGAGRIIDAYGGIGLFAATLFAAEQTPPASTRPITLIEANPSACADAQVNLAGYDASIICQTMEDSELPAADLIIADPARSGLGMPVVHKIDAANCPTLILISCDPVSFARDSKDLLSMGWRLQSHVVLDLFPDTHHVEVVARFTR